MVAVLHVDPELLQRYRRVAPHAGAGVERREVEVAARIERLGADGIAQQEVLKLRTNVKRVEAKIVGALYGAAQDVPRVALVRRALGGQNVAEDPPHALLIGAPRQHGERARIGHRDHV